MRTWLRSFNATAPKTPEAAQIGPRNGLPDRKKQPEARIGLRNGLRDRKKQSEARIGLRNGLPDRKKQSEARIGLRNGLRDRKKQSNPTMIQAILFRDGLFCLEAVMRGKTTYFRTEARESVLE